MIKKVPIRCKECGKIACYEEELRYNVLLEDITCKKCGAIVVAANIKECIFDY